MATPRMFRLSMPSIVGLLAITCGSVIVADEPKASDPEKRQKDSLVKLRIIALAYHNHIGHRKMLPLAAGAGPDGKPLLSWRVHILNYLDGGTLQDLHNQFKFDEPWDSEHNKQLIEKMPDTYKSPGSTVSGQFKTVYLAPVGKSIAIGGDGDVKYPEFVKEFADKILIVEAADERAVVWTKPDDYEFDETFPLYGLIGLRKEGFLAAFGDGNARFVSDQTDDEKLKAMFLAKPEEK